MQSVPGSVRCVTLEALKTSEGSTGNIPNIRRNIRTPWHHHDITVTSPWQPSLWIEGASHSLHHFFGVWPGTLQSKCHNPKQICQMCKFKNQSLKKYGENQNIKIQDLEGKGRKGFYSKNLWSDAWTSGFREASGPLRLKSASGARHRSSEMSGVGSKGR